MLLTVYVLVLILWRFSPFWWCCSLSLETNVGHLNEQQRLYHHIDWTQFKGDDDEDEEDDE